LAAQAQHEDHTSWLYQASSLALTEAGQKALLHAGLPQQLLHQLYRLPMQSTDYDTDAMREQQHAKLLHACEVSLVSCQGALWRIINLLHGGQHARHLLTCKSLAHVLLPVCICAYRLDASFAALFLESCFARKLSKRHANTVWWVHKGEQCSCIAHTRVHQTSHTQPAPAEPQ